MLRVRLRVGYSRVFFAKIVGIGFKNLASREQRINAWPQSEIQSALSALIKHLQKSLEEAESLARKFSTPTTKIP